MKFKVGDRVQKIIRGGVSPATGTVTYAGDTVQMYDVAWDQTGMPFTTMEMENSLAAAVEVIAVPRALLEKLHLVLDHSEGETFEWDGKLGRCREDIGLLLESNTMNGKGSPG